LRQEETTIDFVGTGRKTKRLVVAESLKKSYEARTVMQNVELVLSPGMALGVLGYNGSGKSTLLKMLAKEIDPDQGTVTHAQKLQVVYFDQDRAQLNPQETLRRTLSDTGHTVTYRGQTIHLAGWIKRFRFQPEQLDLPIHLLSGGEQARAVIAKLMLQPADVLIVDEPTNDLDIPTREVLEESLHEFPGALVLVTHDRYMLEEVCSRFFGLDGKGHHGMFAEYGQWESWLRQKSSLPEKPPTDFSSKKSPSLSKYKKLSYRDQQDYDTIEQRVLDAEALRDKCRAKTEESSIASDHVQIQETYETLEVAEKQVEQLYARWAELEAKRSG
jgi:ATP-binding cassette subfamily F protein uup